MLIILIKNILNTKANMPKRIFDISFSFLGIIFLIPLFIIIALLIKIFSPKEKVLFKQKRIGRNCHIFKLVKFRTMKSDNSGHTIAALEKKNRITTFGYFLRKYKLDEIPELWNVLIGDMSFVGPRPDMKGYADQLKGENRLILKLRPGITGPASLKYANEEEILKNVEDPLLYNNNIIYPDKVKINLKYYYTNNFFEDIVIIFKTVFRRF